MMLGLADIDSRTRDAIRQFWTEAMVGTQRQLDCGLVGQSASGAGVRPENMDELMRVRRLESSLPAWKDAGCKLGDAATGQRPGYVAPMHDLDFEPPQRHALRNAAIEDDHQAAKPSTFNIYDLDAAWQTLGSST
jgi:hypothetical protein